MSDLASTLRESSPLRFFGRFTHEQAASCVFFLFLWYFWGVRYSGLLFFDAVFLLSPFGGRRFCAFRNVGATPSGTRFRSSRMRLASFLHSRVALYRFDDVEWNLYLHSLQYSDGFLGICRLLYFPSDIVSLRSV